MFEVRVRAGYVHDIQTIIERPLSGTKIDTKYVLRYAIDGFVPAIGIFCLPFLPLRSTPSRASF